MSQTTYTYMSQKQFDGVADLIGLEQPIGLVSPAGNTTFHSVKWRRYDQNIQWIQDTAQ